MNTTYLPGALVTNLGSNSRSKMFSSPLTDENNHSPRFTTGLLTGVGVVLEVHGSDVRIICGENIGWVFGGNLQVIR
jgi:hypothetical protein